MQAFDGISHGLEWQENNTGVIETRDLNADGIDEIVVGNNTQHIMVYNGASAVITWDSGGLDGPIQDLEFGDLDGDGVEDLAVLTSVGFYVYDSANWTLKKQKAISGGLKIAARSASPKSEGELVVFANNSGITSLNSFHGTTFAPSWTRLIENASIERMDSLDVDEDGEEEIIMLGSTSINQTNWSFLAAFSSTYPRFWKYQMQNMQWGSLNSAAVADLNGDGKKELVTGSSSLFLVSQVILSNVTIFRTYLPLAQKVIISRGLHGKVTKEGKPIGGIWVYLRFYDGSSWSQRTQAFTDPDGSYSFLGQPGLLPGQYYYVLYSDPGYAGNIGTWHTRSIGSYTTAEDLAIGDFDVQDISLTQPARWESVSLPYTFQWFTRKTSPSDRYELNIFDRNNPNTIFITDPPLGFANSYTMTSLPPGFIVGKTYAWEVVVYGPDGSFGVSEESRAVIFSNTGQAARNGPAPFASKRLLAGQEDWHTR